MRSSPRGPARTVYRHFPTQADLVQGVGRHLRDRTGTTWPRTPDAIVPELRGPFAQVERNNALTCAMLAAAPRANYPGILTSDPDGAPAAANTAFGVIGRNPWGLASLPRAYRQRGQRALGEAIYTALLARAQTEQVSPMVRAFAADQLGRVDEAIAPALSSVEHCDTTGPFRTRAPFSCAAFHAPGRLPQSTHHVSCCGVSRVIDCPHGQRHRT